MINKAILALSQQKRLSATSCMTNMPDLIDSAKELKLLHGQLDIGLHFNLTEGQALTSMSLMSLPAWLAKSHLRLVNFDFIYQELTAQYNRFIDVFGFMPSHIDGHQHVHHFPVVRKALIQFVIDKKLMDKLYIRYVNPDVKFSHINNWFKAQIIRHTGAQNLHKKLHQNNIKHNTSFAGIYNFSELKDYRNQFLSYINEVDNNGLIMCHPGLMDETDRIAQHRCKEFEYFSSDLFLEDMHRLQFRLGRLDI